MSDDAVRFSGGTGATYQDAVVIEGASSSMEGAHLEQLWLTDHFGQPGTDWRMAEQALITEEGRPYDRVRLRLGDGSSREIWFDISSFYGKTNWFLTEPTTRKETILQEQCEVCGKHAPTKFVTLRRHIGLLIIRLEKRIEGRLCKECIARYFWEYTPTTFFLGWWGVLSFFVTPIYLLTNISSYIGSRSLSSSAVAPPPSPSWPDAQRFDRQPTRPQTLQLRHERTGTIVNIAEGATIGRNPQLARIVIDDPQISGLHARVTRRGDDLVIEDAGSSNGLLVNGQLTSQSPLAPGMRLQLGDTQITVLG